jgi:hypothetical protein
MNEPTLSPEKHKRVEACFKEEMDKLVANGATDADRQEPAFSQLLVEKVIKNHPEIFNDREINDYFVLLGIVATSQQFE